MQNPLPCLVAHGAPVWLMVCESVMALQKIKELIEVLDRRKDEALERTFKQVARSFRETFTELVPQGHGSLVMIRKKPVSAQDQHPDLSLMMLA